MPGGLVRGAWLAHTLVARALVLLFVCLAAAVLATPAGAGIGWRGDFETWLSPWSGLQAMPWGLTIVTSPVRQGRYAAKFVVRPGDDPIHSTGERAEIYLDTSLTRATIGREQWWGWSTMFPKAFKPSPKSSWNIFAEFHRTSARCAPPLSFEVNDAVTPARLNFQAWGGPLDPTTCTNPYRKKWNFAPLERNRWYDFVFHVKWSPDPRVGFVQVWVNGEEVVPKTHTATMYTGQGIFLLLGFYRAPSSVTSVVFQDGMRRGDSFADVTPVAWALRSQAGSREGGRHRNMPKRALRSDLSKADHRSSKPPDRGAVEQRNQIGARFQHA
jgi:Polysaccharide lyase